MNRIDETFSALRSRGEMALIPFLTIGDPDLDTSLEIVLELERAGADLIELGVPYSDPLADGPVIQRASERALQNGLTIMDCIRVAKRARERGSRLPFILFTYFNPVLQFGLDRFFDTLTAHDISGVIIPDLPMEEDGEVRATAERSGIHVIPLVAPTSRERVRRIVSRASGFVYCVSSLGVTGMRTQFYEGIGDFLASVRSATDLPMAVGFGISNRDQVRQFSGSVDGVVVGSAIVKQIEEALPLLKDPARRGDGLLKIREFVAELKR